VIIAAAGLAGSGHEADLGNLAVVAIEGNGRRAVRASVVSIHAVLVGGGSR